MRTLAALAPLVSLLVFLLAACDPPAAPSLHDIYLYGADNARYSYAFGEGGTQLVLDGTAVELTVPATPSDDPLAVRGALELAGRPYLVEPTEPLAEAPLSVRRIPLTTDLQLSTAAPLDEVLYFDGTLWFTLEEVAPAGLDTRVVPRPRVGALRGLGGLNSAEADMLAAALESRAPLVVALLRDEVLPERTVDGLAEYRRTGLYLQEGLATDVGAFRAPAESLIWEVVASGSGALGVEAERYELVRDADELRSLWNQAHASQLTVPPLPEVDPEREAVLMVFLGTKTSGGYGLEVEAVTLEGRDLFVDLATPEPAPGSLTTQAITSPWLMLRVLRSGIDVAWFRDPGEDRLLGVARRTR